MDKARLKNAIDSSELTYYSLYKKINVFEDNLTEFNQKFYDELNKIATYIFHINHGISNITDKTRVKIPDLIGDVQSYGEFKEKLEEYEKLDFHDDIIPHIKNYYELLGMLAAKNILSIPDDWAKVYSSRLFDTGGVDIAGKLYVSVDNKDLYQFACILFTKCIESGLNDFEFKVNADIYYNRADNVVIYFTKDNLKDYLRLIEEIRRQYPMITINEGQMLGKEISNGVVLALDYDDGNHSFTDITVKSILKMAEQGIPTDQIVDAIEEEIDEHLKPVMSLLDSETPSRPTTFR